MNLLTLWIASLCGWALLNFWLLPLSTSRWQVVDLRQKMARAGALAVIEKLRDLAAVSLAVVLLLVQLASLVAGSSSDVPKAIIEAAASVYTGTKDLAESYGSTLGVAGKANSTTESSRPAIDR